jgi:Uma2 family endonuclease
LASLPNPETVTYEEWLEVPVVDGGIGEVVDEIILMPLARRTQARIIAQLMQALQNRLDEACYETVTGGLGVVIGKVPLTCRNPDIAVFDRMIEENGYYHSTPQLAIEVLRPSGTRRMSERELRDYGDIGTSEVWGVSPEASTVEVLRLADGHLRRAAILAQGILKPRAFPNVQVDISSIWPD